MHMPDDIVLDYLAISAHGHTCMSQGEAWCEYFVGCLDEPLQAMICRSWTESLTSKTVLLVGEAQGVDKCTTNQYSS
jgi:hypothetical protein